MNKGTNHPVKKEINTPGNHTIVPHGDWFECVACGTQAAYDAFMKPDPRMDGCAPSPRPDGWEATEQEVADTILMLGQHRINEATAINRILEALLSTRQEDAKAIENWRMKWEDQIGAEAWLELSTALSTWEEKK